MIGNQPEQGVIVVKRTIWVLAILPVLIGACSSIPVTTVYDHKADYTALRTYRWAEPDKNQQTDPRINWQFVDARVRLAANQQLAAKGYSLAQTGQPDFTLVYYVMLESRSEPIEAIEPGRSIYGYTYTADGKISWTLADPTQTRQYTEGSLILDIVDARTNQALWRGTATARLIKNVKPEERERRINEAVRELLKKFPPSR